MAGEASRSISRPSPAKINLTLDILHRRLDGYHELNTILQEVALQDRITMRRAPKTMLIVHGSRAAGVPQDGTNTCLRALKAVRERYPSIGEVEITLEKSIPSGSGLGGGSSNAATTVLLLDELWQLGMDAPFFIRGGAALGTGRGELLETIPPLSRQEVIILNPGEPVSTTAAYASLDYARIGRHKHLSAALAEAMRTNTGLYNLEGLLHNDFEDPVSRRHPKVGEAIAYLRSSGFLAQLSGSGSCIFIMPGKTAGAVALAQIRGRYPDSVLTSTAGGRRQ